MRVLPILTKDGELEPFFDIAIWAVMCHPEDRAVRQRFFDALIFKWKLHKPRGAPLTITVTQASALADAPGARELLEAALGGWGPSYAAQILQFVLGGAGSVGKAEFLVEHLAKQSKGKKAPTSSAAVRAAWKNFRSVSHLWAAYYDLCALADESGHDKRGIFTHDGMMALLGLSETYRRAGVWSRVLDPQRSWTMPTALKLPPVNAKFKPLHLDEVAILQGYRVRRRG